MITDEFIQDFIDEAKVHIEKIEQAFLDTENFMSSDELLNDVFRAVHSIKGTAGFFQLKNIVTLSHAMESVLGLMRSKNIAITENIMDILLKSNDCLKRMTEDVQESENVDIASHLDELKVLLGQEDKDDGDKKEKGKKAAKTDSAPVKKLHVYGKTIPIAPSMASLQIDAKFSEDIAKLVKSGHNIYKIVLVCDEDISDFAMNLKILFGDIGDIGVLIDVFSDISDSHDPDVIIDLLSGRSGEVRIEILASSVLEAELFAEALSLPKENIIAIDVKILSKQDEAKDEKNAKDASQLKNDETIRVNVKLLEKLMNLSGEMVLARNQLLTAHKYKHTDAMHMSHILQNIDNLTSTLQKNIMLTRMQPVSNVFGKFPRIIREMSKALGKEIDVLIEGKDVELDKSIIESLADPLAHLVRNAADHGIESKNIRQKANKPLKGLITLKAFHKGSSIVIEVSDDGAGIDVGAVKRKAIEKSLVTLQEAAAMSDEQAKKLILQPGFSTAKLVSDISGRGVGMDVVKSNIEKLGGTLEITSSARGTKISLLLPRTLAIIQALMIEICGQRFAVPQSNIVHVVNVKESERAQKLKKIHAAKEISLRGELIPIIEASSALDIKKDEKDKNLGETNVVVLKTADTIFAIGADKIFEIEEILVKPLPSCLKNCSLYSGVTIMGDGLISLILDCDGLLKKSGISSSDKGRGEKKQKGKNDDKDVMLEHQNMILFKCSGDEAYAIDMNMVSRVHTIDAADIEEIGDKLYAKINGKSIRVIRPEDWLPVKKRAYTEEKLVVIMPNLISHPIGILALGVIDNVKSHFNLDTESIASKGIFGSMVYKNKIYLILNIYELFEIADPINHPTRNMDVNMAKRVLIVEDTPFFQHVEKKYLEAAGCEVTVAENGVQALDILQKKTFDVVVSDIIMPIMGGLELIEHIRRDDRFKDIPAVAVSSMTADAYVKDAIANGFDAFECKLNKETLVKTVQNVIKSRSGALGA